MPEDRGRNGELLDLASRAARAAADLIRERARERITVAATKSSEVDVVTETDRDSERLIQGLIAAERPEDAFLGEEGEDVGGTSDVRWVVDPIDGTVNFLYGLPEYAVSVAAQVAVPGGPNHGQDRGQDGDQSGEPDGDQQWETVAGVVINVPRDVEYAAWTDRSGTVHATRAGRPIGVRDPAPLSHRLLATGFSYDAGVRLRQADALTRLIADVRDIRRNGSAALELCHVAEGTLDGYFEEGVHLWDFAAGAHVARGAGARVWVSVGQTGRTFVVCAPEHGFDELVTAVRNAGFTQA